MTIDLAGVDSKKLALSNARTDVEQVLDIANFGSCFGSFEALCFEMAQVIAGSAVDLSDGGEKYNDNGGNK